MSKVCTITGSKVSRGSVIHRRGMAKKKGGVGRHVTKNVPRTFAQIGNAVLMEYIGDVGEPAPRLSDVVLEDEEAQPLFNCIMHNIELALTHGRIHGDLSGYNILYWHEAVTLIDFAQAVDPYHNSDVFSLFLRDIERICQYFAPYKVQCNAYELAREIWSGHMGPIPELI